MAYTLDDIYTKLNELDNKLKLLKEFDYEAKNLKNVGNIVVDNNNNPLSVYYAKNANTIQGKTYDEFLTDIKNYLTPLVEDIKNLLKKQNDARPLSASYIKDWDDLEIDKSKNIEIYTLDTLEFTPSYIEILFKVEECSDKNGGTNGIITQIPPIGVSIDGIPFSYDNYDKVKNYSGYWIEDNQVKTFLKKADFPQWIGNCQKIKFKILAWR